MSVIKEDVFLAFLPKTGLFPFVVAATHRTRVVNPNYLPRCIQWCERLYEVIFLSDL
uniref:Uncharacterized protein n=1 Tax=Anguilla anguilla TaxID=7936 RepID=A0A0E9UA01_ANGAN